MRIVSTLFLVYGLVSFLLFPNPQIPVTPPLIAKQHNVTAGELGAVATHINYRYGSVQATSRGIGDIFFHTYGNYAWWYDALSEQQVFHIMEDPQFGLTHYTGNLATEGGAKRLIELGSKHYYPIFIQRSSRITYFQAVVVVEATATTVTYADIFLDSLVTDDPQHFISLLRDQGYWHTGLDIPRPVN